MTTVSSPTSQNGRFGGLESTPEINTPQEDDSTQTLAESTAPLVLRRGSDDHAEVSDPALRFSGDYGKYIPPHLRGGLSSTTRDTTSTSNPTHSRGPRSSDGQAMPLSLGDQVWSNDSRDRIPTFAHTGSTPDHIGAQDEPWSSVQQSESAIHSHYQGRLGTAHDLGGMAYGSLARIMDKMGGKAQLPPELYEDLVGVLRTLDQIGAVTL